VSLRGMKEALTLMAAAIVKLRNRPTSLKRKKRAGSKGEIDGENTLPIRG